MRQHKRVLAAEFRADPIFIIDYLRMSDVSFYGKHMALWVYEDLLWKEELAKDMESVIYNELIKARGK